MIILTLTPSDKEVISGIPKSIEFSTNLSSTIYYTLDGTLPNPLSSVYTEAINLPTDSGRVVVSAVAYYFDGYSIVPSSILTQVYSTDVSDLDRTRYVFFEGIVYSYPGGANVPLYYDQAGDPIFFIDVPLEDIDLIEPSTESSGLDIGTDNQVVILREEFTGSVIDDSIPMYSSVNVQQDFKPNAKLIVIDGRASADPKPVVDLLNGPLMSLRNSRTSWGGIDFKELDRTNYFSGSATRYNYNREKNVIVFTYFDSNSSRWVKSIQDLPAAPDQPVPRVTNPMVFKWFTYGRHQGI